MSLRKVDTIFIIQGNGSWGVEGVCSSNCFCPGLLTHIKFGHWIEFRGVIQIFACLNSILLKVHILWGSVRYFRTQFAFFFFIKILWSQIKLLYVAKGQKSLEFLKYLLREKKPEMAIFSQVCMWPVTHKRVILCQMLPAVDLGRLLLM